MSRVESYVDTVLGNLAKAPEGRRWFSLRDASFTLGGLVGAELLDRTQAETLLFYTGQAIGLGDNETSITMQAALDAGTLAPLSLDDNPAVKNPEKKAEIEARRQAVEATKKERLQSALTALQTKRPDLAYYKNLNGKSRVVKETWGLSDDSIDNFKIGYCQSCPIAKYSDSFTIPYYWGEKLINVRHRLLKPNGNDKYRPERAGLPSMLFNASVIDGDWVILVEGEFKAIILTQYGFPAVAIPGASNYRLVEKTVKLFARSERVYVALDPGAEVEAVRIGDILAARKIDIRLVTLPVKPDDFFVVYGGTPRLFSKFIEQGRRI